MSGDFVKTARGGWHQRLTPTSVNLLSGHRRVHGELTRSGITAATTVQAELRQGNVPRAGRVGPLPAGPGFLHRHRSTYRSAEDHAGPWGPAGQPP